MKSYANELGIKTGVFLLSAAFFMSSLNGTAFAQSNVHNNENLEQQARQLKQEFDKREKAEEQALLASRLDSVYKIIHNHFGNKVFEERARFYSGFLDGTKYIIDNILVPEGMLIDPKLLDHLEQTDVKLSEYVQNKHKNAVTEEDYRKILLFLIKDDFQPSTEKDLKLALQIFINKNKISSKNKIELLLESLADQPFDKKTLDALKATLQKNHPNSEGYVSRSMVGSLLSNLDSNIAVSGFDKQSLSRARDVFAEVATHINPNLTLNDAHGYIDRAIAQNPKDSPQLGVLAYGASLFDEAAVFGQYDVVQMLAPGFTHLSSDFATHFDQAFNFMDREFAIKGDGSQKFLEMEKGYYSSFADGGNKTNKALFSLRIAMSLNYGEYGDLKIARKSAMSKLEGAYEGGWFAARKNVGEYMKAKIDNSSQLSMSGAGGRGPASHMPIDTGAMYIPTRFEHNMNRIGAAAEFSFDLVRGVAKNTAKAGINTVKLRPLRVLKSATYDMFSDAKEAAIKGGEDIKRLNKERERVDAFEKIKTENDASDKQEKERKQQEEKEKEEKKAQKEQVGNKTEKEQEEKEKEKEKETQKSIMINLGATINPEYLEPKYIPPLSELIRIFNQKFLEQVKLDPEYEPPIYIAGQAEQMLFIYQMSLIYPLPPDMQRQPTPIGEKSFNDGVSDPSRPEIR